MSVRLPVLIDPCPIVDATVEVRFEAAVPDAVVIGLAYQALVKVFPKVSQIQSLPVPDEIRKLNPALMYLPQFRFESEDFVALLGPNMFVVGVNGPYTRWSLVSKAFGETLDRFRETNVIRVPQRFGLKYINFFPGNVLSRLNVRLAVVDAEMIGEGTFITTTVPSSPFKIQLQVVTDAKIQSNNPKLFIDPNVPGTILSLDSYKDQIALETDFLEKIRDNLELAHTKEKELFFRLLKEEFLQTLRPQYQNAT